MTVVERLANRDLDVASVLPASPLPDRARVVIVGGGIIGASIAYHLTRAGEKDVVLLERGRLTNGTTWHAAGLVSRVRGSHALTELTRDNVATYERVASRDRRGARPPARRGVDGRPDRGADARDPGRRRHGARLRDPGRGDRPRAHPRAVAVGGRRRPRRGRAISRRTRRSTPGMPPWRSRRAPWPPVSATCPTPR